MVSRSVSVLMLVAGSSALLAPWPEPVAQQHGEHWAYSRLARPEPPADPFAAEEALASTGGWARGPLDGFVARELHAAGLRPAPEADAYTLFRRASLDLVGLTPDPLEVDAFLARGDTNGAGADPYELWVDHLLASPHWAEHQAQAWLDQARYADSDGYEKDERRTMWRYRDWVIEAFARDLPFDRFTIEQLAGDLLPDATLETRIATGFHRNTMVNKEGGTDPEEFRVAAVKDRVHTTAEVWMGTTLECAQCHDHKFDPFSREDYYRFYAFFDHTEDDGNSNAPEIEAPRPEDVAGLQSLAEEERALKERIAADSPAFLTAFERWKTEWSTLQPDWRPVRFEWFSAEEGTRLALLDDGSVRAYGELPAKDVYELVLHPGPNAVHALRLEVLTDETSPASGPGRAAHRNFVLSEVELEFVDGDHVVPLAFERARADHEQTTEPPYPAAAAIDGELETGWAIAGGEGRAHRLILELEEPRSVTSGRLHIRLRQAYGGGHLIGRFRLSVLERDAPDAGPVPSPAVAASWSQAAADVAASSVAAAPTSNEDPASDADPEETDPRSWFRARAPLFASERARLREIVAKRSSPTALVMSERSEDRETRLQLRGNFLNPGRVVTPDVPAVLPPVVPRDPERRLDRLDLARWLVSPENPLTARVVVNRFWERLFGTGLVATGNDFGTQGAEPSHPELLDWLAWTFIEDGWSVKALQRRICLSSTYRQSSRVRPELLERDPENRYLARAPRLRVAAETVRDVALAASGLLCSEVGGPSVFPPQPAGTWTMTYSGDRWEESEGCDRYRRGLYTFWRRTAPYPSFMLFDATSRELACTRRARTNSPLQALATLNDPAFFELARGMAQRMRAELTDDPTEIVRGAFRWCVTRPPEPDEVALLVQLFEAEHAAFEADVERAAEVVGLATTDELASDELVAWAAWTVVANTLLNLDETLTRG